VAGWNFQTDRLRPINQEFEISLNLAMGSELKKKKILQFEVYML